MYMTLASLASKLTWTSSTSTRGSQRRSAALTSAEIADAVAPSADANT